MNTTINTGPIWAISNLALLWLAALVCVLILNSTPVSADSSSDKEYQVKTAFLLNFARFVTWPRNPPDNPLKNHETSMRFCVLGADPLGAAFDSLTERQVKEQSITIDRIPYTAPLDVKDVKRIAACQLVFVSSLDPSQFAQVEALLANLPILTVTDQGQRGMIDLSIADDVIRFSIDRSKAEKAGLIISSHLLKLAKEVR